MPIGHIASAYFKKAELFYSPSIVTNLITLLSASNLLTQYADWAYK